MTFHTHQCFTDGDGLVNDPCMLTNHSVDGDYSCKDCNMGCGVFVYRSMLFCIQYSC